MSIEEKTANPKCGTCHCYFVPDELKSSGLPYKTCKRCRDRDKKNRKPRKKCPHGRAKYHCVDCGGAGICEHKKQKHLCVDCDGSGICEHKKQKRFCDVCDGVGLCVHKKQKHQCFDCDGIVFCEHRIVKSTCLRCSPADSVLRRATNRYRKTVKENISHKSMLGLLGVDTKESLLKWTLAELKRTGLDLHDGIWSYDHIKPCSAFDLTDEEQIKECFILDNVQTMSDVDNQRKGTAW